MFGGYRGTIDAIVLPYWVQSLGAEFFFRDDLEEFFIKRTRKTRYFLNDYNGNTQKNTFLSIINVLARKNGKGET